MQNYTDMFRLDGRTALVTGAGGGLGRSFACGLAAFGATVICADRDLAGAQETVARAGGRAEAVAIDVADGDGVEAMFQAISMRHGRLDILVNNAGIATPPARTHELPLADWDRLMAINLRGAFLCVRGALPPMLAAGKGSIINIASIAGLVGYYPGSPRFGVAYSAAKAGLAGLTRQVAAEYAREGIRANAIAPGWHGGTNLGAERRAVATQDEIERSEPAIRARTPMGRRGAPDDLIGLVVYLASDASSFVTGQTIAHDGGWTTA